MARVTFDLRGPGSLDDADAKIVGAWLEDVADVPGAAALAVRIRAAAESEPRRRKSIVLSEDERQALLGVLETAFAKGNLNGDLRWLQQSLLD